MLRAAAVSIQSILNVIRDFHQLYNCPNTPCTQKLKFLTYALIQNADACIMELCAQIIIFHSQKSNNGALSQKI